MDPVKIFAWCLDILELTFQHFSAKDLLEFSTINSDWYNQVASKRNMARIRLVFSNEKYLKPEVLKTLTKSPRRYQNVEISSRLPRAFIREQGCHHFTQSYSISDEILEFLASRRDWKDIRIDQIYFEDRSKVYKLLTSLPSSIEVLTIENFYVFGEPVSDRTPRETFKKLEFPQLKILLVIPYDFEKSFRRFRIFDFLSRKPEGVKYFYVL